MLLGLDYDGTYTRDPIFFDVFIDLARKRGHEVVCVTMRRPTEAIEMPCEIVYTSRDAKGAFMEVAGRKVDVWIDDNPKWITVGASE